MTHRRYCRVMRPLRYSINITLDGCCDHRAGIPDEDMHRHCGREPRAGRCASLWPRDLRTDGGAWRPPVPAGGEDAEWMEPFARTINAAKKYVVSSTLDRVDWNAELVRGDLGKAVQQLKEESGKGLYVGGVTLPRALAELGLIDRVRIRRASQGSGPWADVVRGVIEVCRLEAREPAGVRLGGGGDAV